MTKYREPFFKDLNDKIKMENGSLEVICGPTPVNFDSSDSFDFNCRVLNISDKVKFRHFCKVSKLNMDSAGNIIIHFADFKYTSLYYFFIKAFFTKNKLFLHGQGGYKTKGFLSMFVYNLAVLNSTGYICYNKFCEVELNKKLMPFLRKKVFSIDNCLYLEPVKWLPGEIALENKITFIGRVRPRSGLEELLEASHLAAKQITGLSVEIIGSGDENYINQLQLKYPFANFHGAIYTQNDIYDITKKCIAGVYGGDAGLSIVHYMSLGLPVIVHDDMYSHMGPEPSYVVDGINGLLFRRGDVNDMADKIIKVCKNKEFAQKLGGNALNTFNSLSKPTMAEKLLNIIIDRNVE